MYIIIIYVYLCINAQMYDDGEKIRKKERGQIFFAWKRKPEGRERKETKTNKSIVSFKYYSFHHHIFVLFVCIFFLNEAN